MDPNSTNFREAAVKILHVVIVSEVYLTPPDYTFSQSQIKKHKAGGGLKPVLGMDCTQEPPGEL